MEIKTKFNLDDKVFIMYENKPEMGEIHSINVCIRSYCKPEIRYGVWLNSIIFEGEKSISEIKLFSTKAELLDSL